MCSLLSVVVDQFYSSKYTTKDSMEWWETKGEVTGKRKLLQRGDQLFAGEETTTYWGGTSESRQGRWHYEIECAYKGERRDDAIAREELVVCG